MHTVPMEPSPFPSIVTLPAEPHWYWINKVVQLQRAIAPVEMEWGETLTNTPRELELMALMKANSQEEMAAMWQVATTPPKSFRCALAMLKLSHDYTMVWQGVTSAQLRDPASVIDGAIIHGMEMRAAQLALDFLEAQK